MRLPVDLAMLDLKSLRPPRPTAALLALLALLLAVLLPAWLALRLAVPPETGLTVELPERSVTGRPLAPNSVQALRAAFDRRGYDLEAIAGGQADVPALFVTALPRNWGQRRDAAARKRSFVRVLLPLILRENGRVLRQRARLLRLREAGDGDPGRLDAGDRAWVLELAQDYGVEAEDWAPGTWTALLRRVDAVPASLALAQGAKESGWGTSRFAKQGNALFGQWTWEPDAGLAPKQRQQGKGDYAVRAFDRLGGSVAAYLHNLNTHPAYQDLRARRARLRKAGKPLSGAALAPGLIRYSQRGQAYVDEVRAMIRHNAFQRYDAARLASVPTG